MNAPVLKTGLGEDGESPFLRIAERKKENQTPIHLVPKKTQRAALVKMDSKRD